MWRGRLQWPWVWAGLFLALLPAWAFDQEHPAFTRVLSSAVTNGVVDYTGLHRNPKVLDGYLEELAGVTEVEFDGWKPAEQQAFLINLYNAATLRLILDHHPVRSIRRVGGWFGNPWKIETVRLWGRKVSLDHVEHGLLRVRFQEPRVHFALVCAAKGCPPLREEAFTASRLEAQLDDQARRFLAQTEKNRFDEAAVTVWLSPIFQWYESDFALGGRSVVGFLEPWLTEAQRRWVRRPEVVVRYTGYDWSLNGR